MAFRLLVFLAVGIAYNVARGDTLDDPPAMDEDPRCLARKAEQEAYLRSIYDAPVSQGKPCPPDSEKVRQRYLACQAEYGRSPIWKFISDGFEDGSSMLSIGVPFVLEKLGEPTREERGEGFWDIDKYEIPRTLYFPGVTVATRDYVSDAVNFELATGTVKPTNAIYEMRVESGYFQFAHDLTLKARREDVEGVLGLPCSTVAHSGKSAARVHSSYSYVDTSDEDRARYSVTFEFDNSGRIEVVRWYYDSVWH